MAMRSYSLEEFEAELERRGCHKLHNNPTIGFFWRGPDGRHFTAPFPLEEDGTRYPDWVLDDLIRKHQLPVAHVNH